MEHDGSWNSGFCRSYCFRCSLSILWTKHGGDAAVPVLEDRNGEPRTVRMGDATRIVHLEGEGGETVALPVRALYGAAFRRADHATRSQFQNGDRVQVGIEVPWATHFGAPALGRFEGIADESHFRITQWLPQGSSNPHGTQTETRLVSRHIVFPIRAGGRDTVNSRLQFLARIPIEFVAGEPVRYRDSEGTIQMGEFVGAEAGAMFIRSNGRNRIVEPRDVFKVVGPIPGETVSYISPIVRPLDSFDTGSMRRRGYVERVLSGAAHFTSTQEFRSLPEEARMRSLMSFVTTFLPSRHFAGDSIHTLEDALRIGAGVCRHHTALLAMILREAGYPCRVVEVPPSAIRGELRARGMVLPFDWMAGERAPFLVEGHSWVEVDLPHASGGRRTYIVDPTHNFFSTFAETAIHGRAHPASEAAFWYTNPRRQYAREQHPSIISALNPF